MTDNQDTLPASTPPDALTQQSVMLAQQQVLDPKPAANSFDLPCGYLSEGVLHRSVEVREITGYEEDMLANEKMPAAKKMSELLARCVKRVGTFTDPGKISEIVMELIVGDRAFLIFAIRRVTLGDEYPFKDKCPNDECKRESLFTVDLSTLKVKEMPDPRQRIFDRRLPSGKQARFRPMNGHGEEKLIKLKGREDTLSLAILSRLEMLDGKPAVLDDVKALGMRDRAFLRDEFEKVEGGIDTEDDMECPHCGHQFRREVDVAQRSFFFPSAIPVNSKSRSST